MAHPPKSLLIVGGGIVGLCLAVVAQARGLSVTVIARDALHDTASGIAAGMIAPALEAINDPAPAESFQRLKAAQAAWLDMFDLWPQALQQAVAEAQSQTSLYVWDKDAGGAPQERLTAMGADYTGLDFAALQVAGLDPEEVSAVQVAGDWLIEAATTLSILRQHIADAGGQFIAGAVTSVTAAQATMDTGRVYEADHVVVAAGYAAVAFAVDVPCLKALAPIKGHLLDLAGQGRQGVTRSAKGYFADYGARAKFGASMQPGRDDLAIEADVVAGLTARADELLPRGVGDPVTPRVGIRAASPDGWPMIGRDAASGVYVASAMRRNGYVFAPFAARAILDLIEGKAVPDAIAYDPNRF